MTMGILGGGFRLGVGSKKKLLTHPGGSGRIFVSFSSKKRRFRKPMQIPGPQRPKRLRPRFHNSTDIKTRPFSGRFGSKTGLARGKKHIFFRAFALFRVFCFSKPLKGRKSRRLEASPKNRA
jgi:hypothetical protein